MPITVGDRQFQADFQTPGATVVGASLVRRPDAVSLDYLTAFTVGPDTIGDASVGVLRRVWRVRDVGGEVRYARANDPGTDWDAEVVLFTYTGEPILELDCAFEQAGRLVVCAERATGSLGESHIWIYWFDPTLSDFAFDDFGEGRTPRCVLDNPRDTSDSDVLVFYIRDGGPT